MVPKTGQQFAHALYTCITARDFFSLPHASSTTALSVGAFVAEFPFLTAILSQVPISSAAARRSATVTMSYADVAAKGPKQSPEEVRRPIPLRFV